MIVALGFGSLALGLIFLAFGRLDAALMAFAPLFLLGAWKMAALAGKAFVALVLVAGALFLIAQTFGLVGR